MNLVDKYNITTPRQKLAETVKEAIDFAEDVGYPLVAKIVSPDIMHKTEHDLVATDIENKSELIQSYKEIKNNARSVSENIDGVLIQKQVKGIECFIGAKHDNTFGDVVLFGLGGIFVEVFEDVEFRACPIKRKDAREMIEEIKGYEILQGYRGMKADLKSLEEMILKVNNLVTEEDIKELDINPVIVNKRRAYATDIKLVK